MTEYNQIQAKEAIRNLCIHYNLHHHFPGVVKLFKLHGEGKDTWDQYRMLVLKLEGRVRGVEPEDLNMLIDAQGQSQARLIVQEFNDIIKNTATE